MRRFIKCLGLLLTMLSVPIGAAAAPQMRAGDIFLISRSYQTQSETSDHSSSGSSNGRDQLEIRLVAADGSGAEFVVDYPSAVDDEERARGWLLPARIFRPANGPARLLNAPELEARLAAWLRRAGWTKEMCGRWIFTWNAFRIDCDPAEAIALLENWLPPDPRVGQDFAHPLADAASQWRVPDASQPGTLYAELPISADRICADRRRQADVVAQISGAANNTGRCGGGIDTIAASGTIAATFTADTSGGIWRITERTTLRIVTDGVTETRREVRVLERRTVTVR
jgi:hypothetical protein